MNRLRRLFQNPPAAAPAWRRAAWIGAVALAAAIVAAVWVSRASWRKANPLLTTPALALEALSARSLYFNGAARPWLLARRPELLTAEDREERSERVRSFVQAVQNPRLFRQLDRELRFDTLLLVGEPSQYRPLLEHLLEAKDWQLAYLDHTSLIFKRGAERWSLAKLEPVRARFETAPGRERATFLAHAATKLIAVREMAGAKQFLDEAERLDARVPEVWSTLAQYRMQRGEWKEALESAERALKLDRSSIPALACKAEALYATKQFPEAFRVSRRLLDRVPDDPALLFYHAKIAHEARAFSDEIATLEKLVALAEAQRQPAAGYRIYLGQAYASRGDAKPALEQLDRALLDPDLSAEQRAFAREAMGIIRKNAAR